jgi:hypothetical protein
MRWCKVWWDICAVPGSQQIVMAQMSCRWKVSVNQGCLQGGGLSPILWSLVVDRLLVWLYRELSVHTSLHWWLGLDDNLKLPGTASELTQRTLNIVLKMVQGWGTIPWGWQNIWELSWMLSWHEGTCETKGLLFILVVSSNPKSWTENCALALYRYSKAYAYVCGDCVVVSSWSGHDQGWTWLPAETGLCKYHWLFENRSYGCFWGSAWSPPPPYLAADAGVRVLAYRPRGNRPVVWLWIRIEVIPRSLPDKWSQTVFLTWAQDKMIPMVAFGTPFKVEIPSHECWLSTWPMTLQSKGLIWDGSKMAGKSGAGVCGVRPGMRLSFSLGVHASVPGRNFCDFSLCKGIYRNSL